MLVVYGLLHAFNLVLQVFYFLLPNGQLVLQLLLDRLLLAHLFKEVRFVAQHECFLEGFGHGDDLGLLFLDFLVDHLLETCGLEHRKRIKLDHA